MTAFIFKAKLVQFSVNYDGITFYYDSRNDLELFYNGLNRTLALCQLFLVKDLHSKGVPDATIVKLVHRSPMGDIEAPCRIIHDIYDDHDLYHQDSLDRDADHVHFRFHSILKIENIENVLTQFIKNKIMTIEELDNCLLQLKLRYQNVKGELKSSLIGKQTDDQKIINTSEAWAKIEKTFALQLAYNIRTQCSDFTSSLGRERASQLTQDHRFFSIKRKSNSSAPENKVVEALKQGSGKALDEKIQKMKNNLAM